MSLQIHRSSQKTINISSNREYLNNEHTDLKNKINQCKAVLKTLSNQKAELSSMKERLKQMDKAVSQDLERDVNNQLNSVKSTKAAEKTKLKQLEEQEKKYIEGMASNSSIHKTKDISLNASNKVKHKQENMQKLLRLISLSLQKRIQLEIAHANIQSVTEELFNSYGKNSMDYIAELKELVKVWKSYDENEIKKILERAKQHVHEKDGNIEELKSDKLTFDEMLFNREIIKLKSYFKTLNDIESLIKICHEQIQNLISKQSSLADAEKQQNELIHLANQQMSAILDSIGSLSKLGRDIRYPELNTGILIF